MNENELRIAEAATRDCPDCRSVIAADAAFCPRCGAAQPEPLTPPASASPIVPADAALPSAPPPPADTHVVPAIAAAEVTGEIDLVTQAVALDQSEPSHADDPDADAIVEPTESRPPFIRRKRTLVVTAVALALALAVTAGVLLTRKPSTAPLATALTSANSRSADTSAALAGADTMSEVQTAGRRAATAETEVRALLPRVRSSGTKKQRDVVVAALTAHAEYLHALGQLGSLDEAKLKNWPTTKSSLDERVRSLQRAQTSIALLADQRLTAVPVAKAEEAVRAADTWAASTTRKLDEWRASADKVAADKAAQLAAVASYETSFRALVQQYTGLRQDLQDFINRVDSSGATYTEAFAFLSTASAERSRIRNSMKALPPPPPLAGAHTAVVHVVDRAIEAVNAASAGLSQNQMAYYYSYYKDTPGWREFQRSSGAITRAYDEALSAWDAAVTAEKNRVNGIAAPEKPAI